MKDKNIVFVTSTNRCSTNMRLLGIEYMEKKGYKVEVLIVWSDYALRGFDFSSGAYDKGENLFSVEPEKFREFVNKRNNTIYIFHGMNKEYYPAIKAMKRNNSHYIVLGNHGLIHRIYEEVNRPKVHGNFLVRQIKKIKLYILAESRISELMHLDYTRERAKDDYLYYKEALRDERVAKHFKNKPILVTATTPTTPGAPEWMIDDNLVCMHAFDYDRYIENEREGISSTEDYIVFIDTGYTGADYDTVEQGEKSIDDVNRWESQVEYVLNKLEEHYGVPVIIAGHPNVHYYSDKFAGREIVFGKTEKLIPHAKFVIMTMSATVNLALLYKKKILVLVNNSILYEFWDGKLYRQVMKPSWELLGLRECNMDNSEMIEKPYDYISEVSEDARNKYIQTYVKMDGTPQELIIEVVEKKIREFMEGR